MIHFSFSSVLMTILMSNLMLVVIALCFRSENLLMRIGYKVLAVFCIVTLIRLLLPLELPITKTFALPKVLSNMVMAFRHPYGTFLGIDLSLWTLFCIVWFVGAVVFWVRFAQDHKVIKRFTGMHSDDVTHEEPYASILRELCSEKQLQRIRVFKTIGVDSPVIVGLLNSKILLPMNVDVSNDDTLYAIKHEVYHYVHHDLWIKSAVKCLTIVYWWNLFSHLLNKQVDTLLEMRIDDTIMKKGPLEATEYLLSILHFLTGTAHKQKQKKEEPSASLCSDDKSNLYRRLRMMQRPNEKKNYLFGIGMLLLIVGMYIGSYLVILEAYDYGPEVAGYTTASKDNVYAILNEDGTYDVYMAGGHLIETTDNLAYYPFDIVIYSTEEEYHEKNH